MRTPPAAGRIGDYLRGHWRSHAVAAAAGVFLALVGALGTGAAPWLSRLAFWIALLQAGTLSATLVGRIGSRRLRIGESVVLRWVVMTMAVAAPMALLSWGLARVLLAWGAPVGIRSVDVPAICLHDCPWASCDQEEPRSGDDSNQCRFC